MVLQSDLQYHPLDDADGAPVTSVAILFPYYTIPVVLL